MRSSANTVVDSFRRVPTTTLVNRCVPSRKRVIAHRLRMSLWGLDAKPCSPLPAARSNPRKSTSSASSDTMFSGELADHKLTWIKRRLQLRRRAQLRRRVHHQCRPRQGSRQGPANGGRDGQQGPANGGRDRPRSMHLKVETDEQGEHGRSTLIPVLQEAEFSRPGPHSDIRDGGTPIRRGDSGTKNVHIALQGKQGRPSSS